MSLSRIRSWRPSRFCAADRLPAFVSTQRIATAMAALIVSSVVASSAAALDQHGADTEGDHDAPSMSAATFKGLQWRGIGPALMSGRVADIAIHPHDQSTWYVAVGSGNVWKTTNAGTTWQTIFEDKGAYSIGCITLDPQDPDIVWLGTGENVGGRHVGYGNGIYRSRNGGASWEHLGLTESEHIGNIVVHPHDSDTVYVAVQGPLWTPGGQRGLYKTTDGGKRWTNILSAGKFTGCNEVHMDPRDPDTLYASLHQKHRTVAALMNGGPESGIFKSVDGGTNWRELTTGLPSGDMGKIGLAISPQNPDVIYAAIEKPLRTGAVYRSADGGESWVKGDDYVAGGTGPHYYQEIWASPHKFDRLYHANVRMGLSEDGGKSFRNMSERNKHVDNHAIAFDPNDPNYLLVGCDGGLYESWDLGEHWKFVTNLPVTQFYKVSVDYDEPFYNVVGGTQDNATQHGPSRTDNVHGIRSSDWMITVFGDGHQPAIDPTNPDIIYSQWQVGNLIRHDRKTGEIVYIQPQPRDGEDVDRFNWDAPILISPHDAKTLFFASQRLWRSDDRGDSWKPISGDLSRNLDRTKMPIMGRVQSIDATWDFRAMSKFGTIMNVSQSPLDENLIYVCTDDGLVQVTEDGGKNWRKIESIEGLPEFYFGNDIKADLHDKDTVYLCADHHKAGDFSPYIFKSTDRGRTWTDIGAGLPDRHIVWRLVQDHVKPELLFAGTEFGVFFTVDSGENWIKLSGNVPNIPFRDLQIQKRENDLVGATFGRGFYILDDYRALREVSAEALDSDALLFPVRDAWWYIPRRVLGGSQKASQGEDFFVAPNPPFGATFTYYLKDTVQTRKQKRTEEEKELIKQGEDTPRPSWEALREERLEEDPAIMLVVRDAGGDVVRYVNGTNAKGINRVSWSLTYPNANPWRRGSGGAGDDDFFSTRDPADGILVAPGTFSVELVKRVDGRLARLAGPEQFEVKPLHDGGTLDGASPDQYVNFRKQLHELRRQLRGTRRAIDETQERLLALRETLDRSVISEMNWGKQIRELERTVTLLDERINGDPRRNYFRDEGPVSISRRVDIINTGTDFSTYGPTATHRESFRIAKRDLDQVRNQLNAIVTEQLPTIERELESRGLPWTPGRPAPGR